MSRKPAILELAGGKSQRQRVWESIRRFAGARKPEFTVDQLSRASKVDIFPIREYLKGLTAAGYVRITNTPGRCVTNVYEMTRDNGVEAPRVRRDGSAVTQGRGTEALWAAMVTLDSFTVEFVASLAGVKTRTAKIYALALAHAGYLEVLTKGKGHGNGGVPSVYSVSSEHVHGPRAPMITRQKSIYDPNLHRIVWSDGPDAAADAIEVGEVVE